MAKSLKYWTQMTKSTIHADPKAIELSQRVVGMEYNDAIKLTDESKLSIRISRLDGVARSLVNDWNSKRVNVVVENGKIVSSQVG